MVAANLAIGQNMRLSYGAGGCRGKTLLISVADPGCTGVTADCPSLTAYLGSLMLFGSAPDD